MANYPTSRDSFTNPTASDNLNSPDHASQHIILNDVSEAIEQKLGFGPSIPLIKGTVLMSSGSGESFYSAPPVFGLSYRSGNYIPVLPGTNGLTRSMSLNNLCLVPFVTFGGSIDRMAIGVTTAGSAGAVWRFGIYTKDPNNLMPQSLVVDAGTVATDSTGLKEVTMSATLEPGMYWIGGVAQVATCSIRIVDSSWNGLFGVGQGNTGPSTSKGLAATQTSVSGALPSTFTSLPVTSGFSLDAPYTIIRWV